MGRTLEEITEQVCGLIARPEPEGFEPLALRVFAFQFHHNLPYRRYCLGKGKTPETLSHWREIPAVPTGAFKELDLTCLAEAEKPEAVFLTSGTTQGQQRQGRHLIPKLSVYEAAILPHFAAYLLPDHPPAADALGGRLRMMILTGSPSLWPHSSLAYMMEVVRRAFGADGSTYYLKEGGLDLEAVISDLKAAEKTAEPVFLLGITLAFWELMTRVRSRGLNFSLPPGSRIMDTGGLKGHRTEISKEELYRAYKEMLGIPKEFIVNEYGMTEMGSQFYDNVLANHFRGRHALSADRQAPRFKTAPHWVRTMVVDPETLIEVPIGTIGILKHLDLANCGSVMALLTEDLGYAVADGLPAGQAGFELAGRIQGAEARGCSLLIEEMRRGS